MQASVNSISPLDALMAHYMASPKSVQRAFAKYIVSSMDLEQLTKLQAKVKAGVADIRSGKGVSRREGETVTQFFDRL